MRRSSGSMTAPTAARTALGRGAHRASDSAAGSDRAARASSCSSRRLQLRPQHVAGHDLVREVGDGHPESDDLTGEVLGVGEVALGALAVLLDLHAVAVVLAVLREQDQGRGVRGLQREDRASAA